MIETLGTILAALSAIIAVGVLIACYVAWRSQRRMQDHAAEMAAEADQQKSGGGGGPKPVK
jgi:hypothetical protein